MPWDDDKSTASDPDNPNADEQLSADEWDAMVADQKGHASRHEDGGSDVISVAVSQIQSFTSNVLSSISGADISPSSVDTDQASITNTSARIELGTDQSIQSATDTKAELDAVEYDDFSAWDSSNYEYVVPDDGKYIVTGAIQINTLDTGDNGILMIKKNGSNQVQHSRTSPVDSQFHRITTSSVVSAVSGDRIALYAHQNTGSEQTLRALASASHLAIGRVG